MKKFLIFLVVGVLAIGIGTSIKVRANPIQDYESIERINYADDNWEFSSLPFTQNDNWQEYGLRVNASVGELALNGVGYISSYQLFENGLVEMYTLNIITDIGELVSIMIQNIPIAEVSSIYAVVYTNGVNQVQSIPLDIISGWAELIKVIPNIEDEYNVGYQTGYAEGISQNFSSFGSFLTNSVGGFLNFEIFPGFSLMNILWAMLGILLFVIILKVFAGG